MDFEVGEEIEFNTKGWGGMPQAKYIYLGKHPIYINRHLVQLTHINAVYDVTDSNMKNASKIKIKKKVIQAFWINLDVNNIPSVFVTEESAKNAIRFPVNYKAIAKYVSITWEE